MNVRKNENGIIKRIRQEKEFRINLNKSFIRSVKKYVKENRPLFDLFNKYRKHCNKNELEEEETSKSKKSVIKEYATHQLQSSDGEYADKVKNVKFKNVPNKDGNFLDNLYKNEIYDDHHCSTSEIYKFLVNYYGVYCPYTLPTYKKKRNTEKHVYRDDFKWPFLDPPKHPRTVFDTGPTREEIGEYNRRVFSAYTEYLDSQNTIIPYYYNHKFFDEDSDDEETLQMLTNLYKSEVELYVYNGKDYIFQDLCVIRVYINKKNEYVLNANGRKYSRIFLFEALKIYYQEYDEKIDLLNLEDMNIYRLAFCDYRQSDKFTEMYYMRYEN